MSEKELTLYVTPSCGFCHRVKQAAQRLGITLQERDITKDPEAFETLVTKGGRRQVPCLSQGDRFLYESEDIVQYLEKLNAG